MDGISILIPAYKSGAFIEDCIYSLIHQKHTCDYEILIGVDGCEETLNVVKNIPEVGIYYTKENIGCFPMRNSLAKKARFENLLFFDSDDIAQPDLLQKTADSLEKSDAVRWCFYNFSVFGKYDYCKTPAFGAMGIRKSIFLEMNGFATYERFGMDSDFVGRLEQFNKSIAIVEKPMFFRRVHPGSLTRSPDTGMRSPARQNLKSKLIPKIQNGTLENPKNLKTTTLKTMQKPIDINPEKHKIGIGITTFNRPQQLSESLASIKKHTPFNVKIVVVDDGSNIPVPEATFRFKKNQGSPIAKNKCLELLSDCDHIFLFDDDTYPIKEGWELLYINSGLNHLNYTFKYPFELVNGFRHLQNPNGCMMYLTKEVLDKVGGFDTKFIKYGYWHGAFSNRVFNAGLIPHPFIDVPNSSEYIYCLDQNPKKHRTATTNRGRYLVQNKRRYFQQINSSAFINYKTEKEIKVWYSNPFSVEKNIGKALNDFCELVPDGDWICLQDGDMMYLTSDWGKQIHDAIKLHGSKFGLIGCVTNRLGRPIQRLSEMDNNHDIVYHYEIAKEQSKNHYAVVEDVTSKKYIAGMFMLFPKEVWKRVKFAENNIAFDDQFSQDVRRKGYKLGLMKGLYVYHAYRIWSDNPSKDRQHLK